MGRSTEYRAALTDWSRLTPVNNLVPKVKNTSDATYNYTGLAAPGSATSSAVWMIFRTHKTTGDVDHADGDHNYDNIWDSATGLSYS